MTQPTVREHTDEGKGTYPKRATPSAQVCLSFSMRHLSTELFSYARWRRFAMLDERGGVGGGNFQT